MKKLQAYFSKIGSRKFQVLLIAILLFFLRSEAFTGDHLVLIMGIYMGVNVAQKVMQRGTAAGE